MEENKVYRLIESMREKFINESSSNHHMVDIIARCGGEFTVLETMNDCGTYVTKVRMKDGSVYDADDSGGDYFEIGYNEFYAFEEAIGPVSSEIGLISMVIEVNQKNFEAMIALIKNNFKK